MAVGVREGVSSIRTVQFEAEALRAHLHACGESRQARAADKPQGRRSELDQLAVVRWLSSLAVLSRARQAQQ